VLTKPGRFGTARRAGSGKRDQRVYERNRWQSSVSVAPAQIWWIGAGGAVHGPLNGRADSEADLACRWGGHGESLRRNRGDAAGAKLDAGLINRFSVNTGTIPCCSRCPGSQPGGGIDALSVEGTGWGGGPVVVRPRERRGHGEGGQQVSSKDAGMPGGRW
jgi:hypothetical protein